MTGLLKKLFSSRPKPDFNELRARGAVIIDVRTEAEFAGGHVKGSTNIPLDKLSKNLSRLKKDKPIIVCCASGIRSASAKTLLQNNGFTEVYNGGGWNNFR